MILHSRLADCSKVREIFKLYVVTQLVREWLVHLILLEAAFPFELVFEV